MKKFLALVCMITCIFGLTACGSEKVLSDYEQQKVEYAKQTASQKVVPLLTNFMDDANAAMFKDYTLDELAYIISSDYQLNVDGYGFSSAISSFHSAADEVGTVTGVGEATAEISDNQIVVNVQVTGEKKNAEAEVIFSNDMFMQLESAALNPVSSMKDMMVKAALNTLIGMGTVFVVLILISMIISLFGFIPKIQAKFSKKDKEEKASGIEQPVVTTITQEEVVEETDDLELVAVIAAAIAASEGAASADGFVVRSIRKVRR